MEEEALPSFQYVVNLSINQLPFNLIAEVNIYGEVLDVEAPFFNLPAAAQKMMGGKQLKEITRLLKIQMEHIYFRIPLAFYFLTDDSIVGELQEKAKAVKKDHNLGFIERDFSRFSQAWLVQLLKNIDQKGINEDLEKELANFRIPENHFAGLPVLFYNTLPALKLSFSLIFANRILHLLKVNRYIRKVYTALSRQPSPESRKILLAQLGNKKWSDRDWAIILALLPYEDEEVHEALLDFYHQNNPDNPETIRLFLTALKNFPSETAKSIAWEYLLRSHLGHSMAAMAILKSQELTDREIAAFLHMEFANAKSKTQIMNIIRTFTQINNPKFYPRTSDLLMALEDSAGEKIYEYRPQIYFAKLFYKKKAADVRKGLLEMLQSEQRLVQATALDQYILLTGTGTPVESYPFLSWDKESLSILKNAMKIGHQSTIDRVIKLIPRLSDQQIDQDFLNILVAQANTYKNRNHLNYFKALNKLISIVGFDKRLVPVYKSALKARNKNLRNEAATGLAMDPNTDHSELITKYLGTNI